MYKCMTLQPDASLYQVTCAGDVSYRGFSVGEIETLVNIDVVWCCDVLESYLSDVSHDTARQIRRILLNKSK